MQIKRLQLLLILLVLPYTIQLQHLEDHDTLLRKGEGGDETIPKRKKEHDQLLIQHSFALFEMSSYCSLGSHHFLNKPAFASEAPLLACQRQAKQYAHILHLG